MVFQAEPTTARFLSNTTSTPWSCSFSFDFKTNHCSKYAYVWVIDMIALADNSALYYYNYLNHNLLWSVRIYLFFCSVCPYNVVFSYKFAFVLTDWQGPRAGPARHGHGTDGAADTQLRVEGADVRMDVLCYDQPRQPDAIAAVPPMFSSQVKFVVNPTHQSESLA